MRTSIAILPLGLLASLPSVLGVRLQITEVRWADGSGERTEIIDLPYIDDSVLPKDQPCPALPFLTREVTLLTANLTVPTKCWMYTEACHQSLSPITNEDPYVRLTNAAAFSARCFELD